MNEFSLISSYFGPLTQNCHEALNLMDDAALIPPYPGEQLVITTDAMTENVHFFQGDAPFDLGRKLLRVNLSDLAAMGATPLYYLLACIFPKSTTESWIKDFTNGLASDNALFNIRLIGGDTVSQHGPLTLALTAIGKLPSGTALTRLGAKPGDAVYVSGTIGDAALSLLMLQGKIPTEGSLLNRYYLPSPRITLGEHLRPLASSAMDVSDGLLQDAQHIAHYSQVKLALERKQIPLSSIARSLIEETPALYQTILTGGDDYELLFTAPRENECYLTKVAEETGIPLTRIGYVETGSGVVLLDEEETEIIFSKKGYQHFL